MRLPVKTSASAPAYLTPPIPDTLHGFSDNPKTSFPARSRNCVEQDYWKIFGLFSYYSSEDTLWGFETPVQAWKYFLFLMENLTKKRPIFRWSNTRLFYSRTTTIEIRTRQLHLMIPISSIAFTRTVNSGWQHSILDLLMQRRLSGIPYSGIHWSRIVNN